MTAPESIYDWRKVPPEVVPRVLIYGDLHLRQKTKKIAASAFSDNPTSPLRNQLLRLAAAVYAHDGLAIAAPQVGILERIIVIEGSLTSNGYPVAFLNPEITDQSSETVEAIEGCLSFPGVRAVVKRPTWVRISAQNPSGDTFEIRATGTLARVICHETEHLDGVLLIDHTTGLKHKMIKTKMRKLYRRLKGRQ